MLDEKKMEDLKKIKEGLEWIFVAQMIERLEKKWEKESNEEAVSRPSPCEEKPFEKYAKKLNEEREDEQKEEIEKLKRKVKAIEEELAVMREHRHMIYCSNITASPYKPIDHCNCGF